MAKNVDKSVSAKTVVNAILKVEFVTVHRVGRVMFVLIAVSLEHLVLNVKMFVNVIMVVIVIMLLENVSVVQDLQVRNVWTVARAIHSVLIAPKLVVVRTQQNAIKRTAIVLALRDGLVSTVVKEIVPTICME